MQIKKNISVACITKANNGCKNKEALVGVKEEKNFSQSTQSFHSKINAMPDIDLERVNNFKKLVKNNNISISIEKLIESMIEFHKR